MTPTGDTEMTGAEVEGADALLSAMPQALIVVDGSGHIIRASGRLDSVFGAYSGGLVSRHVDQIFGDDNPVSALAARATANRNAVAEHDQEVWIGGARRMVLDAYASPISPQGHCLISLQVRFMPAFMERQAELKGAAMSVSGLAAMLAHEIKNPLSGIRGAAQLLGRRADGRGLELADLICREVDRIGGLVDELEIFSSQPPSEFEALNIHQSLDHAKELALAGFGADITFSELYDPSLPEARGHSDRLAQVFINLFKNSSEAIGNKEEIEIVIRTFFRHSMWVHTADGSRQSLPLAIEIQDNGPGVPKDIEAFLFDPFVTSKPVGSGLGLALVARYVAEMGGLIEYEAVSNGGALFRIHLPIWNEGQK